MRTIVAMFDDQQQAQRVVNRLDALGLEEGRIHLLTRGGMERGNSLFSAIGRAFSAGDGPVSSELTRLGLEPEEAEFYDEELSEDAVIIAVQADDEHEDEVMGILSEGEATIRE